MKKFFIAAGLIGIAFASCKKSDDNGGGSSASVVGKWNIDKQVTSESQNGGTPTVDTAVIGNGSYMDFRSNGKAYLTFNTPMFNYSDSGTYTVSGTNLVVNSSFGPDTYQIITANSNTLELYDTYTDTTAGVVTETKEWYYLSK